MGERTLRAALQRALDVVLLSRVPGLPRSPPPVVSLLLDVESIDCIKTVLDRHWHTSPAAVAIKLDIFFAAAQGRPKELLERWTIKHHSDHKDGVSSPVTDRLFYKRFTTMLRTIHSFCRTSPAFQAYRRVRACQGGSRTAEEPEVTFGLHIQGASSVWQLAVAGAQDVPQQADFAPDAPVATYKFSDVITPNGDLLLFAEYRRDAAQRLMARPMDAHVIFSSYVNQEGPPGEGSQTAPIRIPRMTAGGSVAADAGGRRRSTGQLASRSEGSERRSGSTLLHQHLLGFPLPQDGAARPPTRELSRGDSLDGPTGTPPFACGGGPEGDSHLYTAQALVSCSPPFPRPQDPLSLLSSSPQALSGTWHSAAPGLGTGADHGEAGDMLQALPLSPFERLVPREPGRRNSLGEDALPNEGDSILAGLHGASHGTQEVDEDEDASELPFAYPSDDVVATVGGSSAPGREALPGLEPPNEISSFINLIETAPDLKLCSTQEPVMSPTASMKSLKEELDDCKRFFESLRAN